MLMEDVVNNDFGDVDYLCTLSSDVFVAYQWDYVFDWTVLKYQQTQANRRPPREPSAIGGPLNDEDVKDPRQV